MPVHGGLAFVSSSDTLWRLLLNKAEDRGGGLSHLVSLGAQAEVDLADLIDYLDRRGRVRSLVVDVDRLTHPSKLLTAMWSFARDRPLVAYQDDAGGDAEALSCAVRRSAGIPVFGPSAVKACFELLLHLEHPPQSDNVVLIAVERASLDTDAFRPPPLSRRTQATLHRLGCTEHGGRVTVGHAPSEERLLAIATCVLLDPAVHAVLLELPIQPSPDHVCELAVLADRADKPLLVTTQHPGTARALRQAGLPVFDDVETAAAALSAQTDYVRNLEKLHRPWGRQPSRPACDAAPHLPEGEIAGHLLHQFLRSWNIPVIPGEDPCILHHVRVELRHHPRFGAVVIVGSVDPPKDRVLELVPLNEPLARSMLTRLPMDVSVGARQDLTNQLLQLSEIAVACPQVLALTLSPVAITPHSAYPMDAKALIDPEQRTPRVCPCSYPEHLASTVSLKDGTVARLRPIRPDDNTLWCQMLECSSHESLRLRYHSVHHKPSRRMARRHCCIDYRRELVLVAEVDEQGSPALAGEGELFLDPDLDLAEFAVFVADHWQGIGLGGLLTDRMVTLAKDCGAQRMGCELTPDNVRMITILQRRGFQVRIMIEDAVVFAERQL